MSNRPDPWLTAAGVFWAVNLIGWLAYVVWLVWSGRT